MKFLKTIILLLLTGVAVVFILQNLETVKLSFLKWSIEIPLSFASASIYILGAISGGLIFSLLKKLTLEKSDKKSS